MIPDLGVVIAAGGSSRRYGERDKLTELLGGLPVFLHSVRNFAPLYGVPEESATGTANGALTHYLHYHGIIAANASCRFMQGEAMQRPSVVSTQLQNDGDIWVGGDSVIVAEGDLLV